MGAEGAGAAVAAHDGHTADVEGVVEAALGGMAEIDEDAETVHLGDDLTAEGTDAAMGGGALGRVADIVVAVVAEGHIDDAAVGEMAQSLDGAVEGDAVLDAEHDALQSLALVTPQVVGGACQGYAAGILAHHRLDLVEDLIGIFRGVLRGLGEVGDHDGGILTAFVHLMEIDEDALVALLDAHALGEEHRGVAVGVEGEHTVMELLCLAPGGGTTDEPLEEGCSLGEALGMPLDAEDGLVLAALDGLDDTVGGHGTDTETGSAIGHGLMVEAVDVELRGVVDLGEKRASPDGHGMGGLVAISILRVLDEGLSLFNLQQGEILGDLAAQGCGQHLDASADAEDGDLTVEGQTGDEQFGEVALTVDAVEQGRGFFACPEGIDIAATTEQESVDAAQAVDDDIGIGDGGDDEGHTACGDNAVVIAATQAQLSVLEVTRDAYDGAHLSLRKAHIGLAEMVLQFEMVHEVGYSSNTMGISRFRLCSREMRVSVATTPGMPCSLPLSSSISCSLSRA